MHTFLNIALYIILFSFKRLSLVSWSLRKRGTENKSRNLRTINDWLTHTHTNKRDDVKKTMFYESCAEKNARFLENTRPKVSNKIHWGLAGSSRCLRPAVYGNVLKCFERIKVIFDVVKVNTHQNALKRAAKFCLGHCI